MATRLQVLASESLESKSKNTYQVLQCVLHGQKLVVGKLRVYGDLAKTPIQPGEYVADFDWGEGFGDQAGLLVPRLISLDPIPRSGAKPSAQS